MFLSHIFSFIYESHIATGVVTFFIGPLQFIPYIRENYTHLHRYLGKAYIICVLISSPTGFIISFKTPLILAAAGTAIQSILWLGVTLLAYRCIRKRRIRSHKKWMVRSYALVLAAPMLRILIIFVEKFTSISYMDNFDTFYPLFVWLSFVPLVLVEAYIQLKREDFAD